MPFSHRQDPAYRAWKLPHIRLSIFKGLLALQGPETSPSKARKYLKQFLTLDKESFREVALLLYPSIKLDEFPWPCPSEDRRRLYAAGVSSLSITGCLPLCFHWDFVGLLEAFPNVKIVRSSTTGITFYRKGNVPPEHNQQVHHFSRTQVTASNGSIAAPRPFHPPPNLQYECSYKMDCNFVDTTTAPFPRDDSGTVQLPDVFKLPFEELEADGPFPKEEDWIDILTARKRASIPTRQISWSVFPDSDFALFANAAGPEVEDLTLRVYPSYPMDSISEALDDIMKPITEDSLPGLDAMFIWVYFDPESFSEPTEPDASLTPRPDWTANVLPSKLKCIGIFLVAEEGGQDEDWLDFGWLPSREAEPSGASMRRAIPTNWLHNVRISLGDEFNLQVEVLREVNGATEEWKEDIFEAKLDEALYGPININRSAQTVGQCTCSCGN